MIVPPPSGVTGTTGVLGAEVSECPKLRKFNVKFGKRCGSGREILRQEERDDSERAIRLRRRRRRSYVNSEQRRLNYSVTKRLTLFAFVGSAMDEWEVVRGFQ